MARDVTADIIPASGGSSLRQVSDSGQTRRILYRHASHFCCRVPTVGSKMCCLLGAFPVGTPSLTQGGLCFSVESDLGDPSFGIHLLRVHHNVVATDQACVESCFTLLKIIPENRGSRVGRALP